jgi:hypothetical protein
VPHLSVVYSVYFLASVGFGSLAKPSRVTLPSLSYHPSSEDSLISHCDHFLLHLHDQFSYDISNDVMTTRFAALFISRIIVADLLQKSRIQDCL